jgi:cytoskeletal protein CcmA (bactofilin family)
MFRRKAETPQVAEPQPTERITSVIADGLSLRGKLSGAGGIRIEGAFDGDIELEGLLVIGPTGRVTTKQLRAKRVIVAGALRGDILAERVDIRATGRVWGDVITTKMATEEGAFLRGNIQMEERVELGIEEAVEELPELVEPSGEEEVAKPATADTNGEKPKARKPSKKK